MNKSRYLFIVIFIIIFFVSAFEIISYYNESIAEKKVNEELNTKINDTKKDISEKSTSGKYDSLHAENNDMVGWLSIDGTDIDYPVMYTPYDIEKYLHKDFYGNNSNSGMLFLGKGFSEDANYAIIYGHHMNDGSMFASLVNYQSLEYARSHPIINFNTLNEDREYEVVLAFYSRVYTNQDKNVFRYYQYNDLSEKKVFDEYTKLSKKSAIYKTGVDVKYGDRILVLSTCNYHTKNGRFVLLAKQK